MLHLRLCNSNSHCYANSFMHALLWVSTQDARGLRVRDSSLRRLLQWLVRKPLSIELWQLRAWQHLTRQWREPHRQHDVGEFLQHFAPAFCPALPDLWQARTQATALSTEVALQGELWPLVLDTAPRLDSHGACSLQSLFIEWRSQAHRHAIVSAPALLPVQICRFGPDGSKVSFRVTSSARVYVPLFTGPSVHTTSQPYKVLAVIYHLGRHQASGHYRTALYRDSRVQFVTDDDITPQPPTRAHCQTIEANAYIFFLQRL